MATTGASLLVAAGSSFSVSNRRDRSFTDWPKLSLSPADRASTSASASASSSVTAVTSSPATSGSVNGNLRINQEGSNGSVLRGKSKHVEKVDYGDDAPKGSAIDYFEQAKALIRPDGGPPRWFSPLECSGGGKRVKNAPLLLYLPGIDGVGLGLTRHHRRLGKLFDVWCLHIPVMDRTSFTDLVKLVENTIRLEYSQSPSRPIYLAGESLGGCLAMVVAARNPNIDLVLILANPATSFDKSQLQGLTPLLGFMPSDPFVGIPYLLSLMRGKGFLQPQAFEDLSRSLLALSSTVSVITDILPRETLLWKMDLLKIAASHANSRLHAIKAQTLILSSGMDLLLPSQEEGARLHNILSQSEIRKFSDNGHFLFLVFILDSLPTLASLFATCVNEEATPLCLKWVSSTKGKMKCSFQTIKDTASSVAQDDIKTIPLNLEDPETEDDCKWWGDEVLDPAGYLCHLFKVGFHDVRVSRPGGHNVKAIKEVAKKEESESDDFATPPPPPPRRHILRLPRPQKVVKKEDVPKKRKIEEGSKRAASKKAKREQIVEEVSCPEEDMLAVATPPAVVVAPSSTVGIVVAPEMDSIVPTDALVAPPLPDPTTSNSEAVVEPPVPDPTSSNTEAVVAPPVSVPTTSTISTTKIVPDWVEDLKKQLQAQNQLLSELVKKVEQQDATINQVVMRQKAQTMAQHRIESQCFRIVTNVQRMAGSSKGTKVSKKPASQPPADAPKLEVLGVSSSSEETVSTEKPMPQPQSQPEPQPKEEAEVDQPKEEAVEEKPLPEVDVKGKGKVKTRGPRRMGLREKKPSDLVVSPYVVPVKIPKPPKHSFLSKKDRDAFYTWYLNPKTKKEFITGFQHSANKEHFKLLLQKTGWLWDCQLDEMITYLRKAVIEYPDVYGRVTIVPIPFVDYFNDVRYKQFLELKETGTFNYGEEIACYVLGLDPPFFSKSFFDVDTIYTAINTCGKHWIALQIDLLKWCVVVYDSIVDCMSDGDLKALLTPFLVMFPYILKINGEFGRFGDNLDKPLDYVRKTAKEVPQNNPSGSCGVFTIKHIQYLSSGRTDLSNICQEWVPAFREQFCSILYHREWVKPHESL